ncbi:uncharacterized protein LOC125649328 [Ostrea edulis]|uniref:uncharacterized protein LOC125649328 n=1 Tax=Ostrea edulis TaxID=37623 RepID=UPI0020964EEE|nr:uncharacterized protein LOC125649328 [Ostrea edulis]
MKILPLNFDDTHVIEDGPSQSNKGFALESGETQFNLHEMFDVNDDVGDLVPDVEGCDLFCSESLSDEVDHNVPFSSITLQGSDNIPGGMVYPPIEIVPSEEVFNDANDHLNQRISDDELSQSDSETGDMQMEEQIENQSANINVVRWNPIDDDVYTRNRIQNRDRRVPDLNGSFYDSDEERILSSCSDSDHVVPNFHMEE